MIQNLISMFRMAVVQFQNLRDFYSTSGGFQATILIRHKYCQGKTTQGPSQACSQVPAENYRSENRNYRNKYRSSVLPAQKPQILRKFLRICQLFNILWQRPQDQRPNSITFLWQIMDQTIRIFRICGHFKHILHSTDTIVLMYFLLLQYLYS